EREVLGGGRVHPVIVRFPIIFGQPRSRTNHMSPSPMSIGVPEMTDRRRPPARRLASLPIVLGAAGLLAGCGDDRPTLTVYSGRHYGIETAFEKYEEEADVNVEFLTGNDAELRERIAT